MKHLYIAALATTALIAGGMSAQASCGASGHPNQAAKGVKLPQILLRRSTSPNDGSIVGMWHVNYLVGGNVAFQSFQQWHIDGTEFEWGAKTTEA